MHLGTVLPFFCILFPPPFFLNLWISTFRCVKRGCWFQVSSWNYEEFKSSALQSTWHAVCPSPIKHFPVIPSHDAPQKQLSTCQLRSAAAQAEHSAPVDAACTGAQSRFSWTAGGLQSEGGSNPQQTREEKHCKADEQEGLRWGVCWEWYSVRKQIWTDGEPETGSCFPVLSAEHRSVKPVLGIFIMQYQRAVPHGRCWSALPPWLCPPS